MPLVKVISSKNSKTSKLIKANDLEDLKEKAEAKFGYKIETFKREQDDCEIDDDEAFLELCDTGREFSLIAVHKESDEDERSSIVKSTKRSKPKIKVFSIGEKEPVEILAESLETLKSKAGNKFGIEVDKVVRKDDGTEIDDDDVLVDLLAIEKNLALVVLEDGDFYGKF